MRGHRFVAVLACLTVAAIAAAVWTRLPRTPVAVPGPPPPPAPAPPDPTAKPLIHAREAIAPAAAPAAAPARFEELYARLLALAARGLAEVQAGDLARAKATDTEALTVFGALLAFRDCGERALFKLTGLPEPTDTSARVESAMLQRLVDAALQALAQQGDHGAARLAALTASLLDAIEQSAWIAQALVPLLVDKPWLGPTHEAAVLRLSELVATSPHLRDHAARLISTLWANLERSGARAGSDLETLALMLKDDVNPARRTAALKRLLAATDSRMVDFVLSDVERRQDAELAHQLALHAASDLDPIAAIPILERMRRIDDAPLTSATLRLGMRDPATVRAAYERLVGEGRDADLRADLITGLGFNRSKENAELTRLAFEQDPDPEVRSRALLALSTSGTCAEAVIAQALDDPTFVGPRGERLGTLVSALKNLVGTGDLDATARLGRRLLARADLAPLDRAELRRTLDRALPPELRQGW